MITSISIQNFKGIGERFTLPIKPITLLFGPNSGGKSTIFHALHYLREILSRRNLNAAGTASGGKFVDLGGFANFVHARNLRNHITFQINFEDFGKLKPYLTRDEFYESVGMEPHDFWEVGDSVSRLAVELSIASHPDSGPFVQTYATDVDGARFCTITFNPGDPYPIPSLNFDHPLLKQFEALGRGNLIDLFADSRSVSGLLITDQEDALPVFGRSLYMEVDDGVGFNNHALNALVSRLVVRPGELLRSELEGLRYLGPLREVPSRDYQPVHPIDPQRWTTGIAAWDLLHTDEKLTQRVSEWLVDKEKIDTGYTLEFRRIRELDPESLFYNELRAGRAARDPDERERALLNLPTRTKVMLVKSGGEGKAAPQDVGVGISQLLPVLVLCLEYREGLICVEQPELHLHPRAQCALGDLLIMGALHHIITLYSSDDQEGVTRRADRTIIVETHSEHLILRILRRIRETTRGVNTAPPVTPSDISICYISQEDGQSVPRTIHVDEQGEFIEPWPDSFFEQDFYERFG